MNPDVIIVGLGNHEEKYEGTRHNIGRVVLSRIHSENSFSNWRVDARMQADVCHGEIKDCTVLMVMPNTFMNKSGESVAIVKKEYPEASLIVVHDDLDLPVGEIKVSVGKGAGGHNGVQSIIDRLKTKDFTRVRIGITPLTFFGTPRKPKGERAVSNFVLSKFTKREQSKLEPKISESIDLIKEMM